MRAALMFAGALMLPLSLSAQQRTQLTFGATGAQEIVQSRSDVASDRFTGIVLGAEGQLTRNRIWVRLRYAQGRVTVREGDAQGATRDVVEGQALFGLQAMSWLTLFAGPSARAYATEETDQRWLFWTVGGSARGSLLPGRLQTFVEFWAALSANVTNPATHGTGRGADAGLEMRLGASSPLWGRLSYRIESGQAADMRETVESVALTVIYGLPQ
jgi:hypothetical protein